MDETGKNPPSSFVLFIISINLVLDNCFITIFCAIMHNNKEWHV